jgi:hypothetical protein
VPGGAESAMAGGSRSGSGSVIGAIRLVAIIYFYTADARAVRRDGRLDAMRCDATRSRATQAGRQSGVQGQGGVNSSLSSPGKAARKSRQTRAAAAAATCTDETKGKRKGDSKRRCRKDEKRTLTNNDR